MIILIDVTVFWQISVEVLKAVAMQAIHVAMEAIVLEAAI